MSLLGSLSSIGGMIIGGVIGSMIYPGAGTMAGIAIGGALGGIAGSVLFPDKVDINHPPPPAPHENRVQISTYGAPIPIQYGSGRLAGNIIYMQDVVETITRSRHRQDGVRYYEMVKTYTSTFAIAFCEGPVEGIARIWVNGKIFADYRNPTGEYYPAGSEELASSNLETSIARSLTYYRIHRGQDDQTADPSIAALIGAAETPAYRGLCYIVFIDFPVGEYSGVPTIEVEIGPYEIGNCISYDTTHEELFLHAGLSSTISETYDFSPHPALMDVNALTPGGDLIKADSAARTLYVFQGVTPTVQSVLDLSAAIPYAISGVGCNPWNGRIIVGAGNGAAGYDRRTVHYVFEADGTYLSSWQDDSIYGGAPFYAFTPDERMAVQYKTSGYYSSGWQYGDAFVLYSTYLGTAIWRKWGPVDSTTPTAMLSPGYLFGSRPVFDYLYLATNANYYYRFELAELTDSGVFVRAVMPASAKIMTDIRNPRGHTFGPQLTNGFEIV